MKLYLRKIIALVITVISVVSTFTISASAASNSVKVYYKTHCQNIGWTNWSYNGETSGTTGRSLRVESVKMGISGMSGGIAYRTHCQNIGWTGWSYNGAESGTTGRSLRAEALQVKLTGEIAKYYDVVYRTHCQNIGWTGWSYNGETSGTTGRSLRIEAIQIKLVPKAKAQNTNKNQTTNNNSSVWQMPMKNAYCTWKSYSNMSWATYTNRSGDRDYHLGLDIYGTNGNIYAASNGKVVAANSSNKGANGRYIIIQHTISGKTVYSFYAHLSKVNVSVGQNVSAGTHIGVAGGSGNGKDNNYGTHLHFAIVDTLWSGGGYYGYAAKFTGNKVKFQGVTYYNPKYVIDYDRLP